MFIGLMVVACWALIAMPLFAFLRPDSPFWRYRVSIPMGAIIGGLLITTFLFATDSSPMPSLEAVLSFALSGAASGGTMFGLLSWRNRRIQARNA